MSTKRKVYTFYIIAILVMVLVLMFFDLNIMAKAIVGLMIVFCIFVMRSIQTAYQLSDDIGSRRSNLFSISDNTSGMSLNVICLSSFCILKTFFISDDEIDNHCNRVHQSQLRICPSVLMYVSCFLLQHL